MEAQARAAVVRWHRVLRFLRKIGGGGVFGAPQARARAGTLPEGIGAGAGEFVSAPAGDGGLVRT